MLHDLLQTGPIRWARLKKKLDKIHSAWHIQSSERKGITGVHSIGLIAFKKADAAFPKGAERGQGPTQPYNSTTHEFHVCWCGVLLWWSAHLCSVHLKQPFVHYELAYCRGYADTHRVSSSLTRWHRLNTYAWQKILAMIFIFEVFWNSLFEMWAPSTSCCGPTPFDICSKRRCRLLEPCRGTLIKRKTHNRRERKREREREENEGRFCFLGTILLKVLGSNTVSGWNEERMWPEHQIDTFRLAAEFLLYCALAKNKIDNLK